MGVLQLPFINFPFWNGNLGANCHVIQLGFAGAAVTSSERAAAGAFAALNATVAETRARRSPQSTLFRRAHVRRLRDDSEIPKLRVSMVMEGLLL